MKVLAQLYLMLNLCSFLLSKQSIYSLDLQIENNKEEFKYELSRNLNSLS